MNSKVSIEALIKQYVRDPELQQLLLRDPDLVELSHVINSQFRHYEEQLIRYQERLRFNLSHNDANRRDTAKQVKNLTFQAYHDPLTGLPNRNYLFERTEAAIMQAHRTTNPFALMFIDLDGFKAVNDNYGHDFGDLLLQLVAQRLKDVTRETDMVARLAGDEFCILLMNMDSPAQSARVAASVLKAFENVVELNGYEFVINMSIGISHYPVDGQSTKQLMKNADVAMYEAKKRGSNQFQFYEQRLTERVAERLEFEKDLGNAITNNELVMKLQPCMDLSDGSIEAIDVDMEWHHSIRGQVQAELFFQGITNSHLLMPILQWQIEQCLKLQQVWRMRGYPESRLRVYVDQRQLFNKELFKYLAMATADQDGQDFNIELVIDESTLSHQMSLAKRLLVQCQHQGFKTGIHFRAVGFLPLATLQDCRLSSLMLSHHDDTINMNISARNTLIRGIQNLTKAIDVQLIVSSVDNKSQKELYEQQGINLMSGDYFSEYMSVADFEKILDRFKVKTDLNEPITRIG